MILLFAEAYSQVGFRVGYSTNDFPKGFSDIKDDKQNLNHNLQFGFVVRSKEFLFVHFELFYMNRTGRIENRPGFSGYVASVDSFGQDIKLHSINMALMLGLNFLNHEHFKVRIFGGITPSFNLDAQIDSDPQFTNKPIRKSSFNSMSYSLNYGIGIDVWHFFTELRFSKELSNYVEVPDGLNYSVKENYFCISAGIMF